MEIKPRTMPTLDEEKLLWDQGIRYVVGVDEVGRGAFAGPVVTAAVVFSSNCMDTPAAKYLKEINDSKLLAPQKREELAEAIKKICFYSVISTGSVATINKYGIHKATFNTFRKTISTTLNSLPSDEVFVLADGFYIPYVRKLGKKQKAIIKGDRKSISIAAASIIAKVHRDALMRKYHDQFTSYNFFENKGYGTKEHRDMIKKHGLTKLHRSSFNLTKFLQ